MTDFELLVIGAVIGAFICLICMMIGVVYDGNNKRQFQLNNNHDSSADERNRDRGSDNGSNLELEEQINALQNVRFALSANEREALEYAVESILIRDKLEKWLGEKINE